MEIKARVVNSLTKKSKKGNDYTVVSVRTEEGEVGKIFSDMDLKSFQDEDVTLDVALTPDQGGFLRPRILKIA